MSTATERLARYIAAETLILKGQEVSLDIGSGARRFRFADLAEVRQAIRDLQAQVAAEENAGKPNVGGLGFKLANLSGDT